MKITNGAFVRKSLTVFSAAISLIAFISCGEDTGLGSTIDTEAPKIAISYPNPKVSNVARDEFVLAGTCSDDKLISRVQVAVTNLDTQTSYGIFPATLDAKSNTWSVKLNTFDASNEDNCNGYPFPDGNYKFVATAYDNAGHSTQDTSSFEIDNTAPVVVLTSPGSTTTATEYGSSFYVEGTIAEEHTVSSLKVTIYDDSGIALGETDVTPYIENDIATAGGTNVSFMKFSTGSASLRERYKEIYGSDEGAGTKNYTCAIYVSDNAKEFKNPSESTSSDSGNETSVFYLYSDVYKTLMSANGFGLTAADLMRIINGTYTASDDDSSRTATTSSDSGLLTKAQLAEVKAILSKKGQYGYDSEKSKATDTSENHLKFSLNPKVNPTYTISGLSIEEGSKSYPSGTKNQTITFILSPGLDGTAIEAATVKAYLLKYKPVAEVNENGLSEDDYSTFLGDPKNFESDQKAEVADLSEKYDSDTMLTSLTATFKLPEIVANYFYIIALSGVDADQHELVPDGLFGFVGALSGTPPSVTIETPISQSIIGDSKDVTFTGKVVTTEVKLESLAIEIDVSNVETGDTLTTENNKITASGSGKDGDSVTWGEPVYDATSAKYTYEWTCNLKDCENYSEFSAEAKSEHIYSYAATVKATDTSGNTNTTSRTISVDTVPPKITINSILPSVTDYTDATHTDKDAVYANGSITVSGSIEEMNLKSASYTVLVNGETVKKDDGEPDEKYTDVTIYSQFKITIDTTKLTDDSDFKIVIAAEDRANSSNNSLETELSGDNTIKGNYTSYSTAEYYGTDSSGNQIPFKILQETDRPVISLTNADASITTLEGIVAATENIFEKSGKLTATIIDDDGVKSVSAFIRKLGSTEEFGESLPGKYTSSNNMFSATLPDTVGDYEIKLYVVDSIGNLTTSTNSINFAIAVDDGVPTFSNVQPGTTDYYNDTISVSGKVSDESGVVSLKIKDSEHGTSAKYSEANTLEKSDDGAFTFSDTITVPDESNTYTVTYIATDKYGQSRNYPIQYIVDRIYPKFKDGSFAIGNLKDGFLVSTSPKVTISAKDEGSGIAAVKAFVGTTEVSLSGADVSDTDGYTEYTGYLSLKEGENSVLLSVTDKAENSTQTEVLSFIVDTIDPMVSAPVVSSDLINKASYDEADFTGITISSTVGDTGSGVSKIWLGTTKTTSYKDATYKSELSENQTASSLTGDQCAVSLSIPKADLSDGNYTFYLFAMDKAERSTVSTAIQFTVDTTPPVIEVSNLEENAVYTESDVTDFDSSARTAKYKVSGTWLDEIKGTESLEYSTDGGNTWTKVTGVQSAAGVTMSWASTIEVKESTGNTLSFRAKDKAGNISEPTTYSGLIFDFSTPTITVPSTIPSQTKDAVTVTGNVSDSLAISKDNITIKAVKGTSTIWASLTENTAGKDYSYSLEILATSENNGTWTLSFEATDVAGQKTTLSTKTVLIDNKIPTLAFDWEATDKPATASGSYTDSSTKVTYFNGSKPLTVKITAKDNDEGVGLSDVEYNIVSGKIDEWSDSLATINSKWTSLSKDGTSDIWEAKIISDFSGLADGNYTIFIRSSDKIGNETYSEALYLVNDTKVPALEETVPSGKSISSDGTSYEAGNFNLSGTISDTNFASLEYKLDSGVPVTITPNNGTWTINNNTVTDEGGEFKYVITATDKAGNTTKLNRTIVIDKSVPVVSVDDWKDSTNTFDVTNKNSSTVTFSGSVKDNDGGSGLDSVTVYYINASGSKIESTVNPDSDGKWTYTFTNVAEGTYTLHLVAKDNAGNEKVERKAFGVDLATPVVIGSVTSNGAAASTGTDGNYIVKDDFTLSGSVSDKAFRAKNVTLTVKKDGGAESKAAVVLKQNDETVATDSTEEVESLYWSYTKTVESDGLYTYKLTATDDAGNTKESSFIVRVDKTAPTITVVEPVAGANFTPKTGENTTTVNLSGTAFDSGTGVEEVSYKVYLTSELSNPSAEPKASGKAIISNGTWTASVNIDLENQGNYTLVANAKDYLDNSDGTEVSFYCDNTAPVLSNVAVTTDKDESYDYYNTRIITITASASDAVSGVRNLTYSLNGGTARTMTLSSGTTAADEIAVYTAEVSCAEGANSIIISATDANGNTTSGDEVKTLTFKVDSVAPSFVATSVSSTESNADVTVRGTITEAQGLHSTNGLKVTATKDGEPVTNETLLNAIQPTYTAGSALSGSAWNFTLTADTTNHSTDGSWVFTITAKDVAGNESTTTASVLIDTVAPTLNNIAATVSYEKPSTTDSITYFNGSKPLFLSIITKDNEGGVGLDNVEYNIVSGHKTEWADTLVTTNSSWNSLSKSNSTDTPADTWKTTIISDFADLDDGAYTIFVRSSDKLGNKKYSTPLLLVNDQTVPTLTESTTVNSNYMAYKESSATNATLSGNVNDKNEDESSAGYFASLTYTLTADISIEETVKSGTITPGANGDWSLTTPNFDTTTGGTFTYNFTAIDKAGNKAEVRRIIVKDLVAPEVLIASLNTITDLTSSNTVNSSNCTFKGTAKDNIELKEVYAYIRANSESDPTDEWIASNKKSFTTDSEHSWEVTFSNVNEDWYTLYVVAKDSAGNENTKTQIFGVDNAAPTTSLTLTANKVKAMSGTSSYDLDASGNYTISGVANKASWDDGVTYIASETFRIGGVVTEKFDFTADDIKLYVNKETTEITKSEISTNETTGVKTLTWYYEQTVSSTEGESDGLYTYKLEATDASGNSQTYQFIVRIDTLGPSTTILSPASGAGINGSSFEISGTASDVGTGVASVTYKIFDTSNETPLLVSDPDSFTNGRWTATVKNISEGNLRLEATSIDYLGHPSNVTSVEFYYDSTAPSLSDITVTPLESGNTQYNTNSSIEIGVTATDAVSGVANVTYKIGSDGSSRAMTLSNESYVGWPTFTETGTYTIYVDAVDKQNNSTPISKTKTINVDADAPNLVSSSVKIDDSAVQETYYTNGKSDITISGTVTDIGSGIKSVTILPYEKNTTDKITATLGTSTTAGGVTSVPFSKAIDKSKITKSGTVYALIEDKAGNTTYVNLVALTYDATAPKIQSATLAGTKVTGTESYTAYKSGKDENGNDKYYVNTTSGNTFLLSGVSTDNLGLAKLELSVNGTNVTVPSAITAENSLSEWKFENVVLASDSTTATLRLTDKAGNTATKTITLVNDVTAPTGVHETDSMGKDLYFRIGDSEYNGVSDVGGKYSSGTYGNDTTIKIRGNFEENENGSGTSLIYYKLFNGTAPKDSEITEFRDNPEDKKTGYFSPLSSSETKTVSKNTSSDGSTSENVSVVSTFKTNIAGFSEGNNYLVLLAVDNVGNKALDNVTYTYTPENGTETSLTGCYSINVDTVSPVITKESETFLTNGTGSGNDANIVIEGYATDAAAGIKTVTVSVTVGDDVAYATVTPPEAAATDEDVNRIKWTATLAKSVFSSGSGTYTVYAKATDNAGVGNSQTVSVAQVTVDKIAPTVKLTKPTNANSESDDIEINGTISLSGTVSDANPLRDNETDGTSNTITAIRYVKVASSETTIPDNDSESWQTFDNSKLTSNGNYTFTTSGFDTTVLDDENYYYIQAVAIDKAGNLGYSTWDKPVKISQDTDRPKVRITNLTEQSDDFILMYGTAARITAQVTDDDGIDTVILSESAYTGAEGAAVPTTSSWSATNSTVTFTPSSPDDGSKTVYVYVKDTAGKKFYTTYTYTKPEGSSETDAEVAKKTTLGLPKISVNDTALSDSADAAAFSYFSDSTSPRLENIQALSYKADGTTANGGYNEETKEYTEYETVNASYVVGGTEKQKVKFQITASDANGVAGIALEISYTTKNASNETVENTIRYRTSESIADSNYTADTIGSFTPTAVGVATPTIWTTQPISFEGIPTGSVTIKAIPYDNSGLQGNGNATFMADNTAPTIVVTSPSNATEVTGAVSISGRATDTGSAGSTNIQWIVPTKAQVTALSEKTDAQKDTYLKSLTWNGGTNSLADKATVASWQFNFDGTYNKDTSDSDAFLFKAGNPLFDVYDSSVFAQNTDYASTGLYYLHVYFLATDALGNSSIYGVDYSDVSTDTAFYIKHNPDADKPKLEFSYPTTANYVVDSETNTKEYAVLGGTIRVTGSAEIPSGTTTVNSVYFQIADSSAGFTSTDKAKAMAEAAKDSSGNPTGYGYKIVTAYEVLNEILKTSYTSETTFDDAHLKSYGFASNEVVKDWWGIKATGTAAWNFKLNDSGELNPAASSGNTNNTNDITLRVCGVNAEGKFGAWTTGENIIAIHVDNGAPEISYAVNQYDSGTAAITGVPETTPEGETTAVLKTPTASRTYESNMYLKGYWTLVTTLLDEDEITSSSVKIGNDTLEKTKGYFEKTGITNSAGKKGVTLYIPIPKTSESVAITVSTSDREGHTAEQTFNFKIDETAPTLENLTGNGTLFTSSDFESIENKDYIFTVAGKSLDEGSGVQNVVFYYMRKNGTTGTILTDVVMDPMITTGTDDSKVNMKDADGNDALTALEYTQGNDKFYLYANAYSGNATTDTFTSSTSYDAHVREYGLIQIDGVLRTITDITDTTVTFTPSLTEAKTSVTAYFPIAQVIDNSATEKVRSYSANPFTFDKGDDGDKMPESFSKSGKTWTWDASIHSDNMPDGPVSLVILAFDEAGNVAGTTINTKITNNAPRLAKVFLGTDLSGDGNFTNSDSLTEIVEYDILGAEGQTQSAYTLDFTEKLKNKDGTDTDDYKYPNGVFTIKNGLAVIPELTGGNGLVGMVLKTGATDASAVTGTGENLIPCDSDGTIASAGGNVTGTFTGTVAGTFAGSNAGYQMHSYVVASGNLGNEGTGRGMSFTFWDSTEETTQGSTSQKAVLYVKNFTVAQTDSTPPTVVVNPFYWQNLNSNSIYGSSDTETVSSVGNLAGHIELEDDLPTTFTTNGTGINDRDPKVSGKITFTGTAYDEHSLASLKFSFGKTGVATFTDVPLATYDKTNSKWTIEAKTLASDGYEFTVSDAGKVYSYDGTAKVQKEVPSNSATYGVFDDETYFNQDGHKVYWTLSINTEKVSTAAATDMVLTVLATDAIVGTETSGRTTTLTKTVDNVEVTNIDAPVKSTGYIPGMEMTDSVKYTVTDGTTNYPVYQMDVVPYVTKVSTSLSSLKQNNPSVFDRTALGHYPVRSNETVTFTGFNLGSNTTLDISSLGTSGQYNLVVNNISALNNLNSNNAKGCYGTEISNTSSYNVKKTYAYNRMPNNDNNNLLTDDIWFAVWQFNSEAAVPISGKIEQPVMKIRPTDGKIGFAFVNGPLYFSMGGSESVQDYSYKYWIASYDFFTSAAFTYDSFGNSWGCAAGGDINSDSADAFTLMSSKFGIGRYYNHASYNGDNTLRLERIGQYVNKTLEFDKQRIKSPSIVTAPNGTNTNVYMTYYDAINDELRFKSGTTPDEVSYVRKIQNLDGDGWTGAWIYTTENGTTMDIAENDIVYFCDENGEILENDDFAYRLVGLYKPNDDVRAFQISVDGKNNGYTQKPFTKSLGRTSDSYNNYSAGTLVNNSKDISGDNVYIKIVKGKAEFGQFKDSATSAAPNYNATNVSIVSGSSTTYKPGIYSSLAVVPASVTGSNDTVIAVWLDQSNAALPVLRYAYNSNPVSSPNSWTYVERVFPANVNYANAGEYCRVEVDSYGGVHIAAYDAKNLDLCYAYLPASKKGAPSSSSDFVTCIVDANGVVGSNLTLDVGTDSVSGNVIPHIGYYATSSIKPKLAYYVDGFASNSTSILAGSDDDAFTGAWECVNIPTASTVEMQSNQHNDINIGLWKTAGVISASTTGTSEYKNTSASYNSSSYGQVYGNGTKNAVLGYAIKYGSTSDRIETAQMK